ncbi:Acyltransferase family protein [Georgfuchsia toluolica]|uniref:Acyltransferase family protein n=1 Tax=Georgfuchsia toluolica TaxID=424218 RepID=A0A916N2Q2_9PROT|nr:Acyltransferase family protein [Georgfuchsia toluolica]
MAILSVVAYHALPAYVPGGFVGVDVFFVISGFLISTIIFKSLADNDFSFLEFYAHRIRRIFPALLIVMACCFVLGWFALLPEEYKQLGKHIAAGAGFVLNFILWKEAGYFDVASELKPLMHLWSLAIEEQFYLGFPLLIWLAWRIRINLVLVISTVLALSFGANMIGVHYDVVQTFFVPQTRFWELMTGVLLAWLSLNGGNKGEGGLIWGNRCMTRGGALCDVTTRQAMLMSMLSLVGLALILASVFLFNKTMPYPGARAAMPVAGSMLLILAGQESLINRILLSSRVMVFVGIVSYPLYLWHWPLLSFARILESETLSLEIGATAVTLSFILAALTYRLVEKPIRYGGHAGTKSIVLCILMALVGFIGYNAFDREGLPFRQKQLLLNNERHQFRKIAASDESRCLRRFPTFRGYCLLAKDSQPTIAVIGDSLTPGLFNGLKEATANDASVNILGLSLGGMLPLMGVSSYDNLSPYERQAASALGSSQMVSIAGKTASVELVVMVGNWTLYIDPQPDRKMFVRLADRPEITDNREVYRIALTRTFSYLLQQNKQVVFVLNQAGLNFDPQSCANNRPLRLGNEMRSTCAVSRDDFERHNREYREIAASVLKDFPSVKVFDVAKFLCDDQWCWAMKGSELLYADRTHFSRQGGSYIAQFLAPVIQEARLGRIQTN